MMKLLSNKKFLLFLGLLTFIVFIFSLFYKPPTPLPEVIQSSPTQNSNKVNYFDTLTLRFNQAIDPSLITISSTPAEDWSIDDVSGDTVSLKSKQYFQVDTSYVVNISYKNQLIYTLSFKTTHQQSDPRYAQEVMNEIKRDYPLAVKTPYETADYSVTYSKPLTLEITLKNSTVKASDVISEVKSWVTKNGGDSLAHQYTIAPATGN